MTYSCSRLRNTDNHGGDSHLANYNYRTATGIKRDGFITQVTFGVDGKTPVSLSTFKDGVKTAEADLRADGKTPDTVMNFRPDGTVSSLTDFSDNGEPLSTTHFAADGFTPESTVYYALDLVDPMQ